VRISPNELAIADVGAFSQIHKVGSGFHKSPWYDTIAPNRRPGIFTMRNPHKHSARRRLFAAPFSNSALKKNWAAEIRSRVETAVLKIRQDASNGDADVLRWWTLMASDLITHLCFGESFGMLEQGKVRYSSGPDNMSPPLRLTLVHSKHRTSTRSNQPCSCPS
jgi:cytochrome P450